MRIIVLAFLFILPGLAQAAPDLLIAEPSGNLKAEKLASISAMLQSTASTQLKVQGSAVRLEDLGGSCFDPTCYQREAESREIPYVLISDVVQMQGLYILNVELRESSGQYVAKAVLQGGGVGGLKTAATNELGSLFGKIEVTAPEPAPDDIFGFDDIGADAAPKEDTKEMTEEEKAARKRQKELEARSAKEQKAKERRARQDAIQDMAEAASPLKAPPGGIVIGSGLSLNTGNPMVSGRGLGVNVHVKPSPQIGFLGAAAYIPDLGASDLKGLTNMLVQIAHSGSTASDFQQPLDKINALVYGAGTYSLLKNQQAGDIYGNLFVGGGLGIMTNSLYYATYDPSAADSSSQAAIVQAGNKMRIPMVLNIGMDRWPTNKMGYRLLVTHLFSYQLKPQYDPNVPEMEYYLAHNVIGSVELLFSKGN